MIRIRLLVGFVLVALLPLIGVGIGTYLVSYRNGQQQSFERLESVAARKELAIQGWVQSLEGELQSAVQADYAPRFISNALRLADEDTIYLWYNNLVRNRLEGFVNQSTQFDELFLMDLTGRIIISTNLAREGKVYRDSELFRRGLKKPFTQLPFAGSVTDALSGEVLKEDLVSVFAAIPLYGPDGRLLGVMSGRGDIDELHTILNERTGLGETGKAYFVDHENQLLRGTNLYLDQDGIETSAPNGIHTEGVANALELQANVSGLYADPLGSRVAGVYRWMPELQAALAVEQDFSETFQAVAATLAVNLVIAMTAIVLAVFASLLLTRSIANPIIDLAGTASEIAKGNFDLSADTDRKDEVGVLARAFNSMTLQLRDLINTLEKRVVERTRDLQKANEALNQRAIQMETSARVGREITSILNLDVLLTRVVEMIQDAFGYYHVQVYLLDKEENQLVLRATSGGRNTRFRQIPLEKTSINSQAALTGIAVMVNDVTRDEFFLYDDLLPETHAELVIPLRLGDQVIGTLDVHAAEANAFSQEDVLVIQSLGDQIVVAIENARLYDQSRELAVLEERNRLGRELHDSVTQSLYSLVLLTEGWRRQLNAGGSALAEDYLSKIGSIAQDSLKQMRILIHELRPPTLQQEGLVGALQKRLDVVENRVGIEARVIMEDFIELQSYMEDGLYWIALEALNNALKHADASREIVHISMENGNVVLEVVDNGKGFDVTQAEQRGGMGLNNMHERARQMGGSFTIQSAPGEGTVVRVSAPILSIAK